MSAQSNNYWSDPMVESTGSLFSCVPMNLELDQYSTNFNDGRCVDDSNGCVVP